MPTTIEKPTPKDAPLLAEAVHPVPVEPKRLYTVADWDTYEDPHGPKFELRNGEFYSMAGASPDHNSVSFEFGRVIANVIDAAGIDCVVFGSDQRLYIEDRFGFYPDLMVVSSFPEFNHVQALLNPVVVVEVISGSTGSFDRGEKFEKYRSIASLLHVIFVEQTCPSVDHFAKGGSGIWSLVGEYHSTGETLTLTLAGANLAIPLAAIYKRVTFPARPEPTPEA